MNVAKPFAANWSACACGGQGSNRRRTRMPYKELAVDEREAEDVLRAGVPSAASTHGTRADAHGEVHDRLGGPGSEALRERHVGVDALCAQACQPAALLHSDVRTDLGHEAHGHAIELLPDGVLLRLKVGKVVAEDGGERERGECEQAFGDHGECSEAAGRMP